MADNCASVEAQIEALRAEIARIPRIDVSAIIEQAKIAILPLVGGIVVQQTSGLKIDIDLASGMAKQAKIVADDVALKLPPVQALSAEAQATAQKAARDAFSNLSALEMEVRERHYGDNMLEGKVNTSDAKLQAELKNAISDVAYRRELQPIMAEATAARAEAAAKATKEDIQGIRGLINGVSSEIKGLADSVGTRFSAVEAGISRATTVAGEALSKGLEAIGISKAAQTVAGEALSKVFSLASKIAEIFVIIAAIEEIIAQLKTLEVLGARVDAVEKEAQAVGDSVSGILGKLLGLQNRIAANTASIGDVRGIAESALRIGNQATALANQGISIANEAKNDAINALKQAAVAVVTTAAVLALFKGIRVLKGDPGIQGATGKAGIDGRNGKDGLSIPGIQGIAGKNGVDGRPGINGIIGRNGIDGKDGVTTVVQIPGVPGKNGIDGRDGQNGISIPGKQGAQGTAGKNGTNGKNGINGIQGIPGRNGIDVNPADVAGLRALIVAQHAATRANVNATTTGLVTSVKSFFTTQIAAVTALITAIAKNTYVEKALSVLTFAVTLHNGFMLSNNLAQTLGTIIDQALGLILPKGLDGTPINIGNVLGKATHEIIADTIGEANYKTISEDWAKANRIYQAGINVFNQVSNGIGLLSSGLEIIGGSIGKVGNALKIWGVVGQKAYAFMNPQPNFHGKFFEFINNATAEANTIQMMLAIPIGLSAAAVGINDSTKALAKELDQTDPVDKYGQPIRDSLGNVVHYQPGTTVQDPTVTTTAQAQAKADSTNIIAATFDDLFNAND